MTLDDILVIYNGSSGSATRGLYAQLEAFAPRGPIAVKLLQACKASERAKKYTRRFASAAYDKKDWALGELCRALVAEPDVISSWGWGFDAKAIGFEHVLYVDVPRAGQISFHTSYRRDGPDYAGAWDGVKAVAARRICRWAEAVLDGREVSTSEGGDHDVVPARTEGVATEGDARGQVQPEGRQEAFDL